MTNLMRKLTVLLLVLAGSAFGQTILANTTLSSAVTTSDGQSIVVASATGINAPSTTDYTKATYLYVDGEAMEVTRVSGTTIGVIRGVVGTSGTSHASSAFVFVIPQYLSQAFAVVPKGSCTRGNEVALPRVNLVSGIVSDCIGGQWINGDLLQTQRAVGPIIFPPIGNVLYTGVETNGTAAGASTEMYCEEVDLPYSKVLTGLALLNGTTATTDLRNVEFYDAGGKLLANSAAAGVIAATSSVWQKYAFTTPFYAVGPATYYGCFTAAGTTATQRHTITGVNDVYSAFKITGLVYGTIATSITPPGTFTTALGPYLQLY